MLNLTQDTIETVTHIAKQNDIRCKWFQAELTNLRDEHLTEKLDLKYYFKNQDLELIPGTLLIDSEEIHHRQNRGFKVKLGIVTETEVVWMLPEMKHKMFLKDEGCKNLMKGSGNFAAVVRLALYIQQHDDKLAAFKKLEQV